eukprot:gene10940-10080_t
MSATPTVETLVHCWVKDGDADAFAAASLDNASRSVHEDGNLRFDVLQYEDDANHFVLVE